MIRWRRAADSSSVQSGRMFGSKFVSTAVTCVPSLTEGVLDSAERGGYRQGPGSVATPLDGESLRRRPTDVWTPNSSSRSTPPARRSQCPGATARGTGRRCRGNQGQPDCSRTYFVSAESCERSAACGRLLIALLPTIARVDSVSSKWVSHARLVTSATDTG